MFTEAVMISSFLGPSSLHVPNCTFASYQFQFVFLFRIYSSIFLNNDGQQTPSKMLYVNEHRNIDKPDILFWVVNMKGILYK